MPGAVTTRARANLRRMTMARTVINPMIQPTGKTYPSGNGAQRPEKRGPGPASVDNVHHGRNPDQHLEKNMRAFKTVSVIFLCVAAQSHAVAADTTEPGGPLDICIAAVTNAHPGIVTAWRVG